MVEHVHADFLELMQFRVGERPNALAFRYLRDGEDDVEELDYATLDRRARGLAATLQAAGGAGERALLVYPPGLDFVVAFLGCLYAGVVAVPAYPPDPTRLARSLPRLRALVSDADPRFVLATAQVASLAPFVAEQAPELKQAQWIATDATEAAAGEWKPRKLRAEDVAFLQYTSGSTSTPKGVIVTHANLLHNSRAIERGFGHDEGLRGVGWLPLYHDMGLIGNVLQPLFVGGSCTLMSPLDFLRRPSRWLRAISKYGANTSGGPNFAYELCVRKTSAEERAALDLRSWRVAFVGAEPVRASTLDRFADAFADAGFRRSSFLPCYGLAESTLMVSGGHLGERASVAALDPSELALGRALARPEPVGDESVLVGVGTPALDMQVRIVDPATSVEAAAGTVGELWVSGPSVASGYFRREAESASTFAAKLAGEEETRWLKTGDLGFVLDDQVFVTGRAKDLIIVRGKNYYPQDLELSVELADRCVRPGCVVAFGVLRDDVEDVVVVAELDERKLNEARRTPQLVADAIRRAVAVEHALGLSAVVLVAGGVVPKTSSGKPQRSACRDSFLSGSLETLLVDLGGGEDDVTSVEAPKRLYKVDDAVRAKIDRRSTRYRFDLEQDIAWSRLSASGHYFGDAYLEMLGVDVPRLRGTPEAFALFQWALALATCETFVNVEEDIILFAERERASLGKCRSVTLLEEEEAKHIALFRRYAAHLRAERPELAAAFAPELARCRDFHRAATENTMGLPSEIFHYTCWLYALLLEESSIHLYDKIAPDAEQLNPAWLSAHRAHRQEELQHVVTDSVYVHSLDLADADRSRISKLWVGFIVGNWGRMHGVEAAWSLLAQTYPELADAIQSPQVMPVPFLHDLLRHRAFSKTRAATPHLVTLLDGTDEQAMATIRSQTVAARESANAREIAAAFFASESKSEPDVADILSASGPRQGAMLAYLVARIERIGGRTIAGAEGDMHVLDTGVDSVAAVQLIEWIKADFGVEVPVAVMFQEPLLRLALLVTQQLPGAATLPPAALVEPAEVAS